MHVRENEALIDKSTFIRGLSANTNTCLNNAKNDFMLKFSGSINSLLRKFYEWLKKTLIWERSIDLTSDIKKTNTIKNKHKNGKWNTLTGENLVGKTLRGISRIY